MKSTIRSMDRSTRSPAEYRVNTRLLAAGATAGVLFTVVGAIQALVRPGFDISRHAGSMLTLGEFGWIQTVNFVVTGLLLIAGAVGLGRAMAAAGRGTRAAKWSARLLGVYGAGFVFAGLFVPDPALGFPPGTPEGPGPVS